MSKSPPTIQNSDEEAQLAKLRTEIDALDDQLILLLKKRMACVHQVGAIKQAAMPLDQSRRSIIRPGREATMVRRMVSAAEGTLEPAAASALWRILITSAVAAEEPTALVIYAPKAQTEYALRLADHYFHQIVPTHLTEHLDQAQERLAAGQASLALLPAQDGISHTPAWWSTLAHWEGQMRIFATLPIQGQPSLAEQWMLVGSVTPEPGEQDQSFACVHSISTLPESVLKDETLPAITSLACPHAGATLLRLEGYYPKKDPIWSQIQEAASQEHAAPLTLEWLGTAAGPLLP